MAEEYNLVSKKYLEFIWKTDLKNEKSKKVAKKLGYELISKNYLKKVF